MFKLGRTLVLRQASSRHWRCRRKHYHSVETLEGCGDAKWCYTTLVLVVVVIVVLLLLVFSPTGKGGAGGEGMQSDRGAGNHRVSPATPKRIDRGAHQTEVQASGDTKTIDLVSSTACGPY